MPDDQTYLIRHFYSDDTNENHRKVLIRGLTLEEAREHCNDPDTSGVDDNGNPWFDGYEAE